MVYPARGLPAVRVGGFGKHSKFNNQPLEERFCWRGLASGRVEEQEQEKRRTVPAERQILRAASSIPLGCLHIDLATLKALYCQHGRGREEVRQAAFYRFPGAKESAPYRSTPGHY